MTHTGSRNIQYNSNMVILWMFSLCMLREPLRIEDGVQIVKPPWDTFLIFGLCKQIWLGFQSKEQTFGDLFYIYIHVYTQSVCVYCCVIRKLQASTLPGIVQLGSRGKEGVLGWMCRPACVHTRMSVVTEECHLGEDHELPVNEVGWGHILPLLLATLILQERDLWEAGTHTHKTIHTRTLGISSAVPPCILLTPFLLPLLFLLPPPLPPAPALNTSVCRIWFHSAPDQGPWQLTPASISLLMAATLWWFTLHYCTHEQLPPSDNGLLHQSLF